LATEAGGKSHAISCLFCQLLGPRFPDFNCLSQGKLLNVTIRNITGPVIHHRCKCMFRKTSNRSLSENSLFQNKYKKESGPGSSVGTATGYGLDGSGIEFRWGRDTPHMSRPALGPTQPPVQWVPGLSWGLSGRGVTLTPHPLQVPKSKNRVERWQRPGEPRGCPQTPAEKITADFVRLPLKME
jgi:hypothetical protein